MKIFDCFTFDNELDILEIRLTELDKVVDYFVLVEANKTFQGDHRDYVWAQNVTDSRWDKWRDKIRYVQVEDMPEIEGRGGAGFPGYMVLEGHQRDAMVRGLDGATEQDIVMISDVDEIPEVPKIKEAISKIKGSRYGIVGILLRTYIWSLKWRYPGNMLGTAVTFYKPDMQCQYIRVKRGVAFERGDYIEDGGWHLTWFGGLEQNIRKLRTFSHAELAHKEPELPWHINEGYDINGVKLNENDSSEPMPEAIRKDKKWSTLTPTN